MGMFDQTQQQPYGAPMGGYQYNGFPQQPKVMNVLSEDEIKELQATRSQFSLGLTERESKQAACNHRSIDGTSDSLVYDNETGTARCTICGYEFRPIEADTSPESIRDAANRIVDILQTIKLMYTDIPAASAREYFQIIPLIDKVPQLFEFAAKNFAKHEFNQWSYNSRNLGGMAMLANLNNMLGSSQNFGYPQQPMMQPNPAFNPYAQPQGPVGYPQQPQMNPFGFAGASAGYQPQTQGYQYTAPGAPVTPVAPQAPEAQAPQVAPAAPEAQPATTVTSKVTV